MPPFDFESVLATLAEAPAEYFEVAEVRRRLLDWLAPRGVETRQDAVGNLYATRRGGLRGHLMLCAHMDKNLHSNWVNSLIPAKQL